jgi:hypothetical protein
MSDNVELNPGTGGKIIATDDVADVQHQLVKLEFGANGTASMVAPHTPLPVSINVFDGTTVDAFGRLRVSNNFSIGDFKQVYHHHCDLLWTSSSVGAGTSSHDMSRSSTILSVGMSNGDAIVYQSKKHHVYQPGKSHAITFTSRFAPLLSNVRQRFGYFNARNGLFFEADGTNINVVRRSSLESGDIQISQSAWNLDRVDGTGPSGMIADWSKVQIYYIDFQWLGAGIVRFGLYHSSSLVYVHELYNAGVDEHVYMRTPDLPIRYELTNLAGVAVTSSMEQICYSVRSEGGFEAKGVRRSANVGTTARANVSTAVFTPLISIRLKADATGSHVTEADVNIVAADATAVWMWQLLYNPTFADTGSWIDIPNSTVEYNVSRSGAATGGYILASGYGTSATREIMSALLGLQEDLVLSHNLDGTRDELVIVGRGVTATPNLYAEISWREIT